jgi:hypothetical protein
LLLPCSVAQDPAFASLKDALLLRTKTLLLLLLLLLLNVSSLTSL